MSIVEIRAAEGGDDAKLLVCEQFSIYFKFARADIRPISEPVLKEIAAVLKKIPAGI